MFVKRKRRIDELSEEELIARQNASFDRRVMVDVNSGCHLWIGARNAGGYGVFGYTGIGTVTAHRHAYRKAFGQIPDGMCVLHTCDQPSCVNPDHLRLGTQLHNMAEKAKRGRARNGTTGAIPDRIISVKRRVQVGV